VKSLGAVDSGSCRCSRRDATGLLELAPMELMTAESLSAAQEEELYEAAEEAAGICASTSSIGRPGIRLPA
jgi:hypothetical protein